ncbi:MAG: Stp1/IreP family PP2C-type Ser/Thr phosphatase [Nitrospirota bacterium]|nr:Stp1/IreP family PP2C-type Ser/Thr phosphatase [Nitrospirota bacterium]
MNHPLIQQWTGVGLSDIGRVRKLNQDAFSVANDLQLWVLADGMGGHAGGEVASQIAVDTIPQEFQRLLGTTPRTSRSTEVLETTIVQAIETANQRIREQASQRADIKGMGTTIVALAVTQTHQTSQAVIAHAGDSRAYVLRNGSIALWTRDHTLMEERLALNLITTEQVRTHPLRHVLTKALGIDPKAHPTVQTYCLEPTDILLLCSDGLTKMLTDAEIQTLLLKDAPNLDRMATTLVATANRLGGEDNTTVVVIGSDSDATVVDLASPIG